ncbi:hypothetical protein HanOQP8_Chr02g0053391 [Helianthus annuus]|nr:hypothetical protein HanOQP8_Chr02g0053391 [Helianthus annuus]
MPFTFRPRFSLVHSIIVTTESKPEKTKVTWSGVEVRNTCSSSRSKDDITHCRKTKACGRSFGKFTGYEKTTPDSHRCRRFIRFVYG